MKVPNPKKGILKPFQNVTDGTDIFSPKFQLASRDLRVVNLCVCPTTSLDHDALTADKYGLLGGYKFKLAKGPLSGVGSGTLHARFSAFHDWFVLGMSVSETEMAGEYRIYGKISNNKRVSEFTFFET